MDFVAKNSPNKNQLEQKIDNLANAVAKGFEEVHQKIEDLNKKVDKRFTEMDKRFDEMDTRFDRLEFLVSGHDRRIEILEDKVRQLGAKVGLSFK